MSDILNEILSSIKQISVRIVGVTSTLLISIYIVRQYGVEVNGAFQLSFAYVMIASAVAKLGQDQLALREVAKYCAQNDPNRAAAFLIAALKLVIPFGLVVSALMIGAIASLNKNLLVYIIYFVPTVVAISTIWVIAEGMRGWQSINIAIFWQAVFIPLLFLITIFGIGLFHPIDPIFLPLIYSLIASIVVFLIYGSWKQASAFDGAIVKTISFSPIMMFRDGKHFWIFAVLTGFAGWVDLIVLSVFASNDVIGVYQPIIRTGGMVAVFIQMATSGLVARLAMIFAKDDHAEFIRLTRIYWLMIVCVSFLACMIALIFMDFIISMWGDGFIQYKLEFCLYIGIQFFQTFLILPMLISPVIGLEKELVWVQILNLPLKVVSIMIGFGFLGLLGVIYALGFCTLISSLLILFFYIRQLERKGISWQRLMLIRQ